MKDSEAEEVEVNTAASVSSGAEWVEGTWQAQACSVWGSASAGFGRE